MSFLIPGAMLSSGGFGRCLQRRIRCRGGALRWSLEVEPFEVGMGELSA